MITIKQFIEFCEHIAVVPRGMGDMVRILSVSKQDEICGDLLTRDKATEIIDFLGKCEYASKHHITLLILWKTGMRMSGLSTLGLGDYDEGRPALELRYRAKAGTPLNNKERSELDVLITPETADVVSDYITQAHLTERTNTGETCFLSLRVEGWWYDYPAVRVDCKSALLLQRWGAPFDRDLDTCDDMSRNASSKCPGSVSPHALRRGYVTAARNA